MSDLLSLAERVEGLLGPCREVDKAIRSIVDPDHVAYMDEEYEAMKADMQAKGLWEARGHLVADHVNTSPAYTALIDAARTLIPDGYDWLICRANGGLTIHACVGDQEMVFGETPALALTAASLRARAKARSAEGGE